jgi:type II secretory pathway component PulJ
VRGTGTIVGTGITSLTWCSATNQLSAAHLEAELEESAVRVLAVRSRSLRRAGIRAGRCVSPSSSFRRARQPSALIFSISSPSFTGLVT